MNLLDLGLRPGDRVRFRRRDDQRWREGTAERVDADGALRILDEKGAARSIPVEQVQVRGRGPRGGATWEALGDRAARQEQLDLFAPAPTKPARGRRGRST